MSRFQYDVPRELGDMFQHLDSRAYAIARKGLFDGAELVADEIRKNTPQADGDLVDSLFISRFQDVAGGTTTVIGFAGYDSKGVPNPLKAAVLESGTRDGKKKATHFFSRAVRAAQEAAQRKIAQTIENEINNISGG